MSKLSISDVEHIAALSKLSLTSAEKEKFANQLSNVLGYVEELNQVEVKGVEITAQVTGFSNVTVPDQVEDGAMPHKNIAKNAPQFQNGSFVVPGVFES